MKNGKLSINSENIFPIIKKWLYSDHDIFVRELISNGADAITKLKKLNSLGEFDAPQNEEYRIYVVKNEAEGTLKFIDNGIGMTAEEIEKYINDIAFSGATDFLNAYRDKADTDQIIGHFGLGFYSAFMVSDSVEIDTLSYQDGAAPMHWSNNGGIEFEMKDGSRSLRGTEVTLHIAEDSKQFLTNALDTAIRKYCSYMPYPIYIMEAEEFQKLENPFSSKSEGLPAPINDPSPLYLKSPTSVTDEEYKDFYKKAFFDFKDPIFWIHLNMDYPFNLKGIIYFPRAKNEFEFSEGHIKLYNSQVFVADNVSEVVPEFLTVLNGVIDCPDLPLNVSRSALQNDGFVRKISDYIGKKVADKLRAVSTKDRKEYEKSWKDIGPFIEFGVIRDEKFSEQMKENLLFKTPQNEFLTLAELKEKTGENSIYYTTDLMRQSQYIDAQLSEGNLVVVLKHTIEQALISHLEMSDDKLKFRRVDSIEEEGDELPTEVSELFGTTVKAVSMKDNGIAAMYVRSEDARRSADFAKLYGLDLGLDKEGDRRLIINKNNAVIRRLLSLADESPTETKEAAESNESSGATGEASNVRLIAKYIEALARISSDEFSKEEMKEFTRLSNEVLEQLLS